METKALREMAREGEEGRRRRQKWNGNDGVKKERKGGEKK